MSLSEGEAVFYTKEDAMRRMMRALCGIGGAEGMRTPLKPRILLADADDGALFAEAVRRARADGVPLLLYSRCTEILLPEGVRTICLERPFLFSAFRDAVSVLLDGGAVLPAREAEGRAEVSPPLLWNRQTGIVRCGEAIVRLSARESDVFSLLYEASPQPVSRDRLTMTFSSARGNGAEVYISYLRRKLAALPAAAAIVYVSGRGYALIMQRTGHINKEEDNGS